ncbi:MAG: HisA/HisF-related TIM barrel protein [Candidatus Hodgkinia cicadicola]|nr:MAG: HisA/HisF-related TIM barrel protein [Candidatus Hodgkinia cicadicola]
MQFIPSINVKSGKCVRLCRGEFDNCKVYSASPLEAVSEYGLDQTKWLHVVDLDGAVCGFPQNMCAIKHVVRSVDCSVQVGGGIRSLETVYEYLKAGAARVVLGSSVLTDSKFVSEACKRYFGRVALSLDTVDGNVFTNGWAEASTINYKKALDGLMSFGGSALIWTDVMRDGTLGSVNIRGLVQVVGLSRLPVIVSGSVRSLLDLANLRAVFGNSLAGVISGKPLYERVFSVSEAQTTLDAC